MRDFLCMRMIYVEFKALRAAIWDLCDDLGGICFTFAFWSLLLAVCILDGVFVRATWDDGVRRIPFANLYFRSSALGHRNGSVHKQV